MSHYLYTSNKSMDSEVSEREDMLKQFGIKITPFIHKDLCNRYPSLIRLDNYVKSLIWRELNERCEKELTMKKLRGDIPTKRKKR